MQTAVSTSAPFHILRVVPPPRQPVSSYVSRNPGTQSVLMFSCLPLSPSSYFLVSVCLALILAMGCCPSECIVSFSDLYLHLFFIHCLTTLPWHLHCGHTVNTQPALASALRFLSGIMKRKETHNKEKSTQQQNRFLQLRTTEEITTTNSSSWLQNH